MTTTLGDILELLEEIAPVRYAEDWDNPGLQVGDPSMEVRKILTALDPTMKALGRAVKTGAQLLLTHHPLIFRSVSCLDLRIYPGDLIAEAVRNRISVVAAHTNLDVVPGGINDLLARLLGLEEAVVLEPGPGPDGERIGLGTMGNLPGPMPLTRLAEKVKEMLRAEVVGIVGSTDRNVRRVAVVGGSGGGVISRAALAEADVLITGDIRHHDALEAETLGLAVIDAGHFHTEQTAFRLFGEGLKQRLAESGRPVSVETFDDEQNPIKYI